MGLERGVRCPIDQRQPGKNLPGPQKERIYRVVDLALNQSQTVVSPIFRSIGTICGGLFPKMYRGQICNLDILPGFLRGYVPSGQKSGPKHHCGQTGPSN